MKRSDADGRATYRMKSVLDDPAPLANLAALVKAQRAFHAQAAETLAQVERQIGEAAVEAEGEYRQSRA